MKYRKFYWGTKSIIKLQCSVRPCMGRVVLWWSKQGRILLETEYCLRCCSILHEAVHLQCICSAVEVKALCGPDCKAHTCSAAICGGILFDALTEYCSARVQLKALCGPDCSQGGSQPNQLLSPGELNWPYHTILYLPKPNHTIPSQTKPYHTIPDHTMQYQPEGIIVPGCRTEVKWSGRGIDRHSTVSSPKLE